MPVLTTEEVLRHEAKAIHGADLSGISGTELYRQLNELNSLALCLSGGGIRSASFALGIIQALATNPRQASGEHVENEEESFLAKFHYLSTVSGGGYIGSWLSAGAAREGFTTLWNDLVGRPDGPDVEPPVTAWLRSYSNFLTPQLGITSADTWVALALILRNLILNWLVILPVLCIGLIAMKLYALAVAWFSQFDPLACGGWMNTAALLGAASVFFALWFMHSERPAHCESKAAQGAVLRRKVFPAGLSGVFFSFALAVPCAHDSLYQLPWFSWTGSSMVLGGLLYGSAP